MNGQIQVNGKYLVQINQDVVRSGLNRSMTKPGDIMIIIGQTLEVYKVDKYPSIKDLINKPIKGKSHKIYEEL
jgi:hypothetical protein